MSYDLFLKSTSSPLSADQFESYFNQRGRYTINSGQAFYQNEDTGVYFSFDFGSDEPDTVAFNLNYFRPHFFGLEAAPEVAAFIETFNLSIDDPQTEGMGDGPFSTTGFLRGWNAGNRFGYHAILSSEHRPETHVYPTSELERVWNWNFNRESLQNQAGDVLFVPKYMFMKGPTQARASIVWPDACPIYMPKADFVFVLRDELSSTPTTDNSQEITFVEWSDIEPLISSYPYEEQAGDYRLDYERTPSTISEFVRSLPIVPHNREMGLAYDSVLNAELVDEIHKS